MKTTALSKFLIAMLCGLAYAPAFAGYVNIDQARTGPFTFNGPGVSTAHSTAPALAGWNGSPTLANVGCYFAGDTTPSKTGDWTFNVDASHGGYYDVYSTWAANSSNPTLNPIWTVNNANTAVINSSLNEANGANTWVQLTTVGAPVKLNASTGYTVREATNPSGASGKRTYWDSVAWAAATPGAVVNIAPPNGATGIPTTGAGNDLNWTPGTANSFFDVFFDINPTPTTLVSGNQTATTFDPDSLSLQPNTTYYWEVAAKNVDLTTPGTIWSFTTADVPEPSTVALSLLGGFGLAVRALARRRKV